MIIPQNARIEKLVTVVEGDLPVLLTAAHGGKQQPQDIEAIRTESRGYKARDTETFVLMEDENTYQLVFQLAEKIKQRIGQYPYVVAANFSRKFVDANRNDRLMGTSEIPNENHAYDAPEGKKYYDAYHERVSKCVNDIRQRFKGEGLMFDIHGTIYQENKIVVGMVTYDPEDFQRFFRRGHVSVDRLIAGFGMSPLYHPETGFVTALHGKPLTDGMKTEAVPLNRFQRASPAGGFSVTQYGSNRLKGINAFQLDCARKLRTAWLDHTVEIYADAIHTLYRNVVDGPFQVETVFAGKKCLGEYCREKKIKQDKKHQLSFPFALNRTPIKGRPVILMVHTRRLAETARQAMVRINEHYLGNLSADTTVTIFKMEKCRGLERLKRKHNLLTIELATHGSIETTEENHGNTDFDVIKVDVVYSGV